MTSLKEDINKLLAEVAEGKSRIAAGKDGAMPCNTFFLDGGEVVCGPREQGDSRYPYGQDGFNFWAHASGYMYANEGLFSLFLRASEGAEPRIAFFAGMPRADGTYEVQPVLQVPEAPPANPPVERFAILSSTAAFYVAEWAGMRFVMRVFVAENKAIHFSLHTENTGCEQRRFFVSSFFNPYLRHQIYESSEDRWFKEIRGLDCGAQKNELSPFLVSVNEDKDRHLSVTNYGVLRRALWVEGEGRLAGEELTASRHQVVGGSHGSLHRPRSLLRGSFGDAARLCSFTETAVAADLLHLVLAPGACARMEWCFENGMSEEAAALERAGARLDPGEIDAALDALRNKEARCADGISISVSGGEEESLRPAVMNRFFEHLKKQVEFCALLKGYIQLSENSLIGIRDVFQALEGLLFWRPEAARRKMLEALDFTSPDGRCFRQYSLSTKPGETGRMDLRPFIDQGSWVISCVQTYLHMTGDLDFLREACGYHDIVDERTGKVACTDLRESVLDHLIRIMDYLLRNRDFHRTHCVLALYGDWNDALDGLGISQDPSRAYGTGVSVMATLHVYRNIGEIVSILRRVNRREYASRIEEYEEAKAEMRSGLLRYAVVRNESGDRRILHGWGDSRSYLVGSFYDPDGKARDGLTSNAFWVLSGMLEECPDLADSIMAAFRRLDSKYGYKTFEPAFPRNTPGVGRIGKLPAGTAENGASYIHATAFAIMALFQMGRPREAWDQIVKILPFTAIHDNLSLSPFVMPNSYGYNPEKGIDGQSMNDWQTGSSNVMLKLLIRYVFGFDPDLDGVWIQPASWTPFARSEFSIRARGCPVRIIQEFADDSRRTFLVNGHPREGSKSNSMQVERLWIPWEEFTPDGLVIKVTN